MTCWRGTRDEGTRGLRERERDLKPKSEFKNDPKMSDSLIEKEVGEVT